MSQGDLLARILKSLHGAVLDDAEWPRLSGLIGEATGAKANFLVTGDGATSDDVDVFLARFCIGGQRRARRPA